jgi:hypothetical protein
LFILFDGILFAPWRNAPKNYPCSKPGAGNRPDGEQGRIAPGKSTPGRRPDEKKYGANQARKAFFGVFLSGEFYYGYIGVT